MCCNLQQIVASRKTILRIPMSTPRTSRRCVEIYNRSWQVPKKCKRSLWVRQAILRYDLKRLNIHMVRPHRPTRVTTYRVYCKNWNVPPKIDECIAFLQTFRSKSTNLWRFCPRGKEKARKTHGFCPRRGQKPRVWRAFSFPCGQKRDTFVDFERNVCKNAIHSSILGGTFQFLSIFLCFP